jgi:hypothetical protein
MMKTVIFKKGQKLGDLDENDKARLFQTTVKGMNRQSFLVERKWIKQKRKRKFCYNFSFFEKCLPPEVVVLQKQMPSI